MLRSTRPKDYTFDALVQLWHTNEFKGFRGYRCSNCGRTANIPMGSQWSCSCGSEWFADVLHHEPMYHSPTFGPTRTLVMLALQCSRNSRPLNGLKTFNLEQLLEYSNDVTKNFQGFTGEECHNCGKTANVLFAAMKWYCEICGNRNALDCHRQSPLHEKPDFGPTKELIHQAANITETR